MFIHTHSARDAKKSIRFAVKNNYTLATQRWGKGTPTNSLLHNIKYQNTNIRWGYLIVQMPGLVVILGTPTAEERLVIHLDQLPLRTETEVPKNSEHGRKNKRKNQSQPDSYFHSANNVS